MSFVPILPQGGPIIILSRCETCGISHDASYASGRFCGSRCARSVGGKAFRDRIRREKRARASINNNNNNNNNNNIALPAHHNHNAAKIAMAISMKMLPNNKELIADNKWPSLDKMKLSAILNPQKDK